MSQYNTDQHNTTTDLNARTRMEHYELCNIDLTAGLLYWIVQAYLIKWALSVLHISEKMHQEGVTVVSLGQFSGVTIKLTACSQI